MKKWIVAAALVAVSVAGRSGTDVAKLQPVQVVAVTKQDGQVLLQTDTGSFGIGADVAAALSDMGRTSASEVFLDTAEFLLVDPKCEDQLPALEELLRPACMVCRMEGDVELEDVGSFLRNHSPERTLKDWRAGEVIHQVLVTKEGRTELVS